jgi:tetrapyrrole methylase family protein/MazG family protein
MTSITILGLGPGQVEQLTLEAWRILENASEVFLRTAHHPLREALPSQVSYHSFDEFYDTASDFAALYQQIAEKVLELGQRSQGVIYAVPGHPFVGEQTTPVILELARANHIPVRIVEGLSFIEPSLTALEIDGITGLQIHDAAEIAAMHHPPLNSDWPALIAQVYSQHIASHLKLTLMNQYPDNMPVKLVHAAGTAEQMVEEMPLYEIDRSQHIAHLTSLYIPAMPEASSFEAVQEVMAHLRAPEGCPWDREQDHRSLRPYLLEEAYEVLEALDKEDYEALAEEMGDLLLQIVFHAQIATEEGEFAMRDVIRHIVNKMVRRHPHVWSDAEVDGAEHVVANWETIKAQEQMEKGAKARKSQLDGVPLALPALVQAFRIQEKAAAVGFDWPQIAPVIDKVQEEIGEIQAASDDEKLHEFGDLLFAVVNWARWAKIDPESALRETNLRFRRRFAFIEEAARQNGHSLREMSLEQMDALWDSAKLAGL